MREPQGALSVAVRIRRTRPHDLLSRRGADFVWLCVRTANERAQALYRRLGFRRSTPDAEEARRLGLGGDTPDGSAFRMRLDASGWKGR